MSPCPATCVTLLFVFGGISNAHLSRFQGSRRLQQGKARGRRRPQPEAIRIQVRAGSGSFTKAIPKRSTTIYFAVMRSRGVATGRLVAAAICLVVISSSSICSCVEGSSDHVRIHEQPQQQLRAAAEKAEATVDIGLQHENSYKKDANQIRRRIGLAGRGLHEAKTEWHKPDLHGVNGGHHIEAAVPIAKKEHIVAATPIELSPSAVEGRNPNAETNAEDYGEVMLYAQVESGDEKDWGTETPTAAPVSASASEDDGEVEICTKEACFLASPEFNNAYDKCEGSDDTEKCIATSYLTWKDDILGTNLPADPIGTDGGTSDGRPVGHFVTKNQAKNNRRKRNKKKKTQGGLSDEQLIATGAGVKGSTTFGTNRNRRKRKNNNRNKNKKAMYWGDRRWKKQGTMPSDLTVKIDDNMEMKLEFDLQELGLAAQGDILMDVIYDGLSTGADATSNENIGIKGQSTPTSSAAIDENVQPQRVPLDPVPEECRLARKIYNDAVAELIRCDEVLIKKSLELEESPMCTEGSGRFDGPSCMAVLKKVSQDVDTVKRGVANTRDDAKVNIDKHCYQDSHDFSFMAGRPDDDGDSNVHGRSAEPDLHEADAESLSMNKPTVQGSTSTNVVLTEHVVNANDSSNVEEVSAKDAESCKSATKIIEEKRKEMQELEKELKKKLDDQDFQDILSQMDRVQEMLEEAKAEKLLYCSHGMKM